MSADATAATPGIGMAVFVLGFSVLFIAVVATAYRRGERWAWFAAWSYPAVLLGSAAIAAIMMVGRAIWNGPGRPA